MKNKIYQGANNKDSLYDINKPTNWNGKLIIFLHGYMGFKDWGCWNLVSEFFTQHNYAFLKYNVSHNGCTIESPIDFEDLDSFSINTYSKELEDFEAIIKIAKNEFNKLSEIFIIGHSRGGGTALLQAKNPEITKICSWAGISSIAKRFPRGEALEKWKNETIRITKNGRTHQDMPHHFLQYEDYIANSDNLNIKSNCLTSNTPTLIVHGENDNSVSINEGKELADWLDSELIIIPNTAHTFDSKHPWKKDRLPFHLLSVCEKTLDFLNQ